MNMPKLGTVSRSRIDLNEGELTSNINKMRMTTYTLCVIKEGHKTDFQGSNRQMDPDI